MTIDRERIERRRFRRLMDRSSVGPQSLYTECEPCRLAGRGPRVARDPFNDGVCVYGHAIEPEGG